MGLKFTVNLGSHLTNNNASDYRANGLLTNPNPNPNLSPLAL